MRPPRAPEAHLISEEPHSPALGVLVLRAEHVTQAFDMAHSALVVDHEWDDDEATRRLAAATVRAGRWYRTPDNSDDMKGRWLLVQARRTLRGSSPGYYFEFGLVRHYSLPEVEPLG